MRYEAGWALNAIRDQLLHRPWVSADSMKKFMEERGFLGPPHVTSAKTGEGRDQLREAIVEAIDWKSIPETPSPALYHRFKREILSDSSLGSWARGEQIPPGTTGQVGSLNGFFRPYGARTGLLAVVPTMNRWAIFGRPWRDGLHSRGRVAGGGLGLRGFQPAAAGGLAGGVAQPIGRLRQPGLVSVAARSKSVALPRGNGRTLRRCQKQTKVTKFSGRGANALRIQTPKIECQGR